MMPYKNMKTTFWSSDDDTNYIDMAALVLARLYICTISNYNLPRLYSTTSTDVMKEIFSGKKCKKQSISHKLFLMPI